MHPSIRSLIHAQTFLSHFSINKNKEIGERNTILLYIHFLFFFGQNYRSQKLFSECSWKFVGLFVILIIYFTKQRSISLVSQKCSNQEMNSRLPSAPHTLCRYKIHIQSCLQHCHRKTIRTYTHTQTQ